MVKQAGDLVGPEGHCRPPDVIYLTLPYPSTINISGTFTISYLLQHFLPPQFRALQQHESGDVGSSGKNLSVAHMEYLPRYLTLLLLEKDQCKYLPYSFQVLIIPRYKVLVFVPGVERNGLVPSVS